MIAHSYFMRFFLILFLLLCAPPSLASDPLSVYASPQRDQTVVKRAKPKVSRSNMLKYQILSPTGSSNTDITRNLIKNPPMPAHKPMLFSDGEAPAKTVRRKIPSSTMKIDTTNLERSLKPLNAQQVLESISNRKIEQ